MPADRRNRSHARLHSLLEKALRRGYTQLVFTVCTLLSSLGPEQTRRLRARAPGLAFEECWPLGTEIVFNRRYHSKVALLVKVSRAVKDRGAAGLGALGLALARGDRSALEGSDDDRHVRVLASAVRRPDDFWAWVRRQPADTRQALLVANAHRNRNAAQPQERAAIQAAAYLAVIGAVPQPEFVEDDPRKFPYWVALDSQTTAGRRALSNTARDLHMDRRQLELAAHYFEGTVAARETHSPWWERERARRFQRAGLPPGEARLLWTPARPQLQQALMEESRELHREVYRWKMAHREPIAALRRQVEIFNAHFDEMLRSQGHLF